MSEENAYLPFNAEAEKAVLGSIILSPARAESALEKLKPVDFLVARNREIFC